MGLLEAGLLGQLETGKLVGVDAFADDFAEIFLQGSEFHGANITDGYIPCKSLFAKEIKVLTQSFVKNKLVTRYNLKKYNEVLMEGAGGDERDFLEFRRKVRDAELLSASMQRLLESLHFTGRLSVVVQNGQVLKSGYEEGYFKRRPEARMLG